MGKVVSLEELILQGRESKGSGQKLVFVSGCFDLLHPGHIRLLEQARDYGDVLTVGVLSDATVAAISAAKRGAPGMVKRPITPAAERCEILAALAMVDFAFEFGDSALDDIVKRLRPGVIVEGAEPSPPASALREAATRAGIDVVRIPLEPGHSTSLLIERIAQLHA